MFETYTAVFRSRGRQLLLITLLLAPLLFVVLVARADVYRSEAILQVGAGGVAEDVLGQPRSYEEPGRRVATELEILTSTAVEQRAAQRLAEAGWQISDREVGERVVASPRGLSSFVEVVGTNANPVRARMLTQAVVDSYIEYRREAQQADLEQVRDDLQARLRAAEAELAALDASTDGDAAVARERAAVLARFETLTQLVEAVRLRLSVDSGGVRVLAVASTPDGPADAVPPGIAALLSLIGAGLLGSGALLLYDLARDSVRTATEAARLLPTRTLAHLPRFKDQDARWSRALREPEHPASAAAGTLRMRLSGMSGGTFPTPLLVTGAADDADDCVWVAAALAAACGRAGTPVLLVADCTGSSESLLAAGDGPERVEQSSLEISPTRLRDVWSTPLGTNADPGTGLRGTRLPAHEMAALNRRFEVVILVAPVSEVVDAVALSHLASAALVVCAVGRSRARRLQSLLSALQDSDAGVSGMVLTSCNSRGRAASSATPDVVVRDDLDVVVSSGAVGDAQPESGTDPVAPVGSADGAAVDVEESRRARPDPSSQPVAASSAADAVVPQPASSASLDQDLDAATPSAVARAGAAHVGGWADGTGWPVPERSGPRPGGDAQGWPDPAGAHASGWPTTWRGSWQVEAARQ